MVIKSRMAARRGPKSFCWAEGVSGFMKEEPVAKRGQSIKRPRVETANISDLLPGIRLSGSLVFMAMWSIDVPDEFIFWN
jgi:hypothetical protein